MRDILRQILQIPGTVGALNYSSDGTILAAEFPDQYEPSALQQMTRMLSEDFLVQQAMTGPSGGLDLKYAGGRIVVRPFTGGAILALCTVAANTQLVNLALVQAVHRIEATAAEAPPSAATRPGTAAAPKATPNPYPPVAADLVNPGVVAALKQAFLVRIGPIGEMLFTRIYDDWSSKSGQATAGFRTLVALIASEIDDPDDQKSFIRETRNIIG